MKDEKNLCSDTITKVFKIEVSKENISKYIECVKEINKFLKSNYEKYFICNILLQDKCDSKIIYSVEVYNNISGIENTYNEISQEISCIYDNNLLNKIKRTEIKDISEIKKIYPN